MDAINALIVGTQAAQFQFDRAAAKVAQADLPTARLPEPTAPITQVPNFGIDPAEQLTTMMVAADSHHITTAALRVAIDMYQDTTHIAGDGSAESN